MVVVNKKKKPDDENYGLELVRFFEQTAIVKQSEPKTFHFPGSLAAVWQIVCEGGWPAKTELC